MPIPSPRKGQSRSEFISECMHSIGNEYDDKKQAVAICYSKWSEKKAKAAYVVSTACEEYIYEKEDIAPKN